MSWFSGYGGQPTLSETSRDKSYLSGLPSGYVRDTVTGIEGTDATDAYNKFADTGASDADKAAFARRIANQFGR